MRLYRVTVQKQGAPEPLASVGALQRTGLEAIQYVIDEWMMIPGAAEQLGHNFAVRVDYERQVGGDDE